MAKLFRTFGIVIGLLGLTTYVVFILGPKAVQPKTTYFNVNRYNPYDRYRPYQPNAPTSMTVIRYPRLVQFFDDYAPSGICCSLYTMTVGGSLFLLGLLGGKPKPTSDWKKKQVPLIPRPIRDSQNLRGLDFEGSAPNSHPRFWWVVSGVATAVLVLSTVGEFFWWQSQKQGTPFPPTRPTPSLSTSHTGVGGSRAQNNMEGSGPTPLPPSSNPGAPKPKTSFVYPIREPAPIEVPQPKETNESLGGPPQKVDDLTVTEIEVQPVDLPTGHGNRLPALCWSGDARFFYYLDGGTGTLRRIGLKGFVADRRLEVGRKCTSLSSSKEGLLVTVPDLQEIWVINPDHLQVTKRIRLLSVSNAVSSPLLSVAFATGEPHPPAGSFLYAVDLMSGEVSTALSGSGTPSSTSVDDQPAVTPDGKYLFFVDWLGQLHRFRITDDKAVYEQSSPSIVQGPITGGICISPDSRYVCLPTGAGNFPGLPNHPRVGNYSTYVYPVSDLDRPSFTLGQGAYPEAVGFDPWADLVYAQNSNHSLIIFDSTGIKQKEYSFKAGGALKQYMVHPEGWKLLLHTDTKLFFIELPRK